VKNHAQGITWTDITAKETLILHHGVGSPELALTIVPHESKNPSHDDHLMWRDGDGERVSAGAFTIALPIDHSMLDKHFADLGKMRETGDSEVPVLQHILLYCSYSNCETVTPAGPMSVLRFPDVF
jgi:hypothetical protein